MSSATLRLATLVLMTAILVEGLSDRPAYPPLSLLRHAKVKVPLQDQVAREDLEHASARASARTLESSDKSLITALSELEQQSRDIPDPVVRSLFVDRARTTLMLASEVQALRNHPAAALWLSDRARQVAGRSFSTNNAVSENRSADVLGNEMIRAVPAEVTVVYQDLESDRLRTWVIRNHQLRLATTSVSVSSLRTGIEQFRENLFRQNDRDLTRRAHTLYLAIFGPIREWIGNEGLLVYAPPTELRGLPVAALHDGEQFLVQKRPITVTGSLSQFLQFFASRHSPNRGETATLIILPSPPPGSPVLAGARREAAEIAALYGDRGTSLMGTDATPKAFIAMVPDFGRTTITLASAFVAAGASAVVGSLWDVDDESTARLMIDFHQRLKQGNGAADALRGAQQSAMRRHEMPSSWAAFQVQM